MVEVLNKDHPHFETGISHCSDLSLLRLNSHHMSRPAFRAEEKVRASHSHSRLSLAQLISPTSQLVPLGPLSPRQLTDPFPDLSKILWLRFLRPSPSGTRRIVPTVSTGALAQGASSRVTRKRDQRSPPKSQVRWTWWTWFWEGQVLRVAPGDSYSSSLRCVGLWLTHPKQLLGPSRHDWSPHLGSEFLNKALLNQWCRNFQSRKERQGTMEDPPRTLPGKHKWVETHCAFYYVASHFPRTTWGEEDRQRPRGLRTVHGAHEAREQGSSPPDCPTCVVRIRPTQVMGKNPPAPYAWRTAWVHSLRQRKRAELKAEAKDNAKPTAPANW